MNTLHWFAVAALAGEAKPMAIDVARANARPTTPSRRSSDAYGSTAIAAMMELVNKLREERSHDRRIVESLVIMLAPFAPHFAEENWERLGHDGSIFDARWPTWDERLVVPPWLRAERTHRLAPNFCLQVEALQRAECLDRRPAARPRRARPAR